MRQSTQYLVHFLKNHFLYQNVKKQSIKTVVYRGFTCSACLLDFAHMTTKMMKVREEVNFSGFIYPSFEEKVEGLFKDFQFSPFSAKKSLESVFFGSSPT